VRPNIRLIACCGVSVEVFVDVSASEGLTCDGSAHR